MFRALRISLAAALLVFTPLAASAQRANGITVLAAASLTNALEEIGRRYEAQSGRRVISPLPAR